jgi:hypothetical protein
MLQTAYRKQFVLINDVNINLKSSFEDWIQHNIGKYHLITHPDLNVTYCKNEELEVFVLGFLLDWVNPELQDVEILNNLLSTSVNRKDFIEQTFDLFGQFVIIIKDADDISVFNDAAGTKSIFYKSDFSALASTPKLLNNFSTLTIDDSQDAKDFYSHDNFLKRSKRYYIGNSTQYKDVNLLLANHALHLKSEESLRYFPVKILKGESRSSAAYEINKRLDGHTKALVNRFNCEMHVSAGLDSRVMIAYGLKYNIPFVNYYRKECGSEYYDTAIPKKILNDYSRDLEILEADSTANVEQKYSVLLKTSVDFPRTSNHDQNFIFNILGSRKDKMIINGHGGEFGRNSMGIYSQLSPNDMAQIAGYRDLPYARKIYKQWYNNAIPLVNKFNYTLMENFYWEQFFSIWSSKGVAERNLAADYYAFFNNRRIFELMLSTSTKDRNPVGIKLFKEIISQLDGNLLKYPINPINKNKLKNLRYALGVEGIWDRIKFRLRKFKK